jgi:hypothetical protein
VRGMRSAPATRAACASYDPGPKWHRDAGSDQRTRAELPSVVRETANSAPAPTVTPTPEQDDLPECGGLASTAPVRTSSVHYGDTVATDVDGVYWLGSNTLWALAND